MRLINTTSMKFKEFVDDDIPPYAILSHTWGATTDEVIFQDLKDYTLASSSRLQHRPGFRKISHLCNLARDRGFQYAWCDTCCIDKTNSVELSEAINSMFAWYRAAAVCYVYLSDVSKQSDFPQSRWFTRGWTLQELLAPIYVVFFDREWNDIGTKSSLVKVVSKITRVPESILHLTSADECPVGQVMSWAASRKTTRKEDTAYCLLGLLRLNMPMIYGEGNKAFERLQQELLKSRTDHSLFAWTSNTCTLSGLLAAHPKDFANTVASNVESSSPGIKLNIPVLKISASDYQGVLDCKASGGRRVCIFLFKIRDGVFRRVRCGEVALCNAKKLPKPQEICITSPGEELFNILDWKPFQDAWNVEIHSDGGTTGFEVVEQRGLGRVSDDEGEFGVDFQQEGDCDIMTLNRSGIYGGMLVRNDKTEERFVVLLGVHNWKCWSDVETEMESKETLRDVLDCYYAIHYGKPEDSRRALACWDALDRSSTPIGNGLEIRLRIEISRKPGEKGRRFLTTVEIVGSPSRNKSEDLGALQV